MFNVAPFLRLHTCLGRQKHERRPAMGKLYKRGDTYYMHDYVNGEEYRESLGVRDWQEARKKRNERINEIMEGKGGARGKTARQPFTLAVEAYLNDRQVHKAERTCQTDRSRKKPLEAFFGDIPIRRITAEQILEYQKKRKKEGKSGRSINIEVGLLRRVLKKHKLWARLADHVEMLPERSNVGRALEDAERKKLLETAATKPRWMVAYSAAVLALNTTMRSGELRGLRWQDVDLFKRTLTVKRSTTKTDAGERVIPLNKDAMWALGELWNRCVVFSKTEGSPFSEVRPEHYVFPACENYQMDFTIPMKSWRSAWRSLTKEAGLKRLRFHDLRHSSITVLAEAGLSDQTVMSIAGHVSTKMLQHYSHIRLEAKRTAVEALEGSSPAQPLASPEVAEIRPN
jgi:integrase